MKTITDINQMRAYSALQRSRRKTIGFVPTMGALHEGHLFLVRKAKQENDIVVVSIFVNPIQFGPGEDFKKYPRDLAADRRKLQKEGVDIVFTPDRNKMFPHGFHSSVEVEGVGDVLCGRSRPGHFRGVATIVAKLFNIVLPDKAYFGAKDYQQQAVIKKMTGDLNFPVKIITVPTVRQKNGLAMSSRNSYLSREEQAAAQKISAALFKAKTAARRRSSSDGLITAIKRELSKERMIKIDYVAVVDPVNLVPLKKISGKAVIAVAVYIGKTRLIDNITISC